MGMHIMSVMMPMHFIELGAAGSQTLLNPMLKTKDPKLTVHNDSSHTNLLPIPQSCNLSISIISQYSAVPSCVSSSAVTEKLHITKPRPWEDIPEHKYPRERFCRNLLRRSKSNDNIRLHSHMIPSILPTGVQAFDHKLPN